MKVLRAFGLLAALAAPAAHAASPAWDYVQFEAISGRLQSDETGTGSGVAVSLPLAGPLYAGASGSRIRGKYDSAIPDEHYRNIAGGFGLHDTWGKANAFGFVGYSNRARDITFPGGEHRDHEEGVEVVAGARVLAASWLSIEPEGGYSIPNGFARLRVAVRLVPHVWLTGAYGVGTFSGDFWTGGVRLSLNDSVGPPKHVPGAGWVDEAGGTTDLPERLEPGLALVALRTLTLQQKPLFGAREVATVPARAPIELLRAESNEFGGWWYVRSGAFEGWIRETQLR